MDKTKNTFVYYFNPFNAVVYKKQFDENTAVFPDKLRNAYEYPLYISRLREQEQILRIKKPNRKDLFVLYSLQSFEIATKSMNLKWVYKNINGIIKRDVYEKYNFDLIPHRFVNLDYNHRFLMATEEPQEDYVAYVPIIQTSRVDIYFKTFYNVSLFWR